MPVFCLECSNNFTYGELIMKKENSTYDRLMDNDEFKKEFEKEYKKLCKLENIIKKSNEKKSYY